MNKIKISSPDKIIYPKEHITKIEVAEYYRDISELMLPFVKNRLLSVIRCHEGVKSSCFFKKHPTTESEHITSFMDDDEEYFYITTTSGIINQSQMGTIEFHTWGSRVPKVDNPDLLVFDLDPDEKLSLNTLRTGVKNLKSVLDELGLISFLKTSGGKGYHIVLPLKFKDWDKCRTFAEQIALLLVEKWPKLFTANIRKIKRKGKIFVDYFRNSRGSTCVAPYSLRARNEASISFPIKWEDLDKISPNEINIKNYRKYLNDSWDEFFLNKQKIK